MTVLQDAPADLAEQLAEPSPSPSPSPEIAEAETGKPRLTRVAAEAQLRERAAAFADRVVLARQITVEVLRVNTSLCESGSRDFMTRQHLYPTPREGRLERHPRTETAEEAAACEAKIRKWTLSRIEGALEDYTATGLMKQVAVLEKAEAKWADTFRTDAISRYHGGEVTFEQVVAAFPRLGLEPYERTIQVAARVSFDFRIPASATQNPGAVGSHDWNAAEVERLRQALLAYAGERADFTFSSYPLNASSANLTVSSVVTR